MKNEYLLTVVTTTYNQENYIEDCLKGITKQKTNFKFKLIISDDCSTDNTRKIIQKYEKKFPNIVKPIYRKTNLGAMDNFAETLNLVDTKYVALCDGDDYWTDENKLQKQVEFLEENPDFNICFHQTEIFFEKSNSENTIYPSESKSVLDFNDIITENTMPANSVVYRWKYIKKDSFKKDFPTNIVPGDHYVHLMHAKDGKIKFIPEVMSRYRRHDKGFWWLTANSKNQEQFHLKYGIKFLNFYNEVEKNFNVSKKTYINVKKYICSRTILAYLKNNKYDELNELHKLNENSVEECMKEICLNLELSEFSGFKKILYMFLFQNKLFRTKLKNKLKRK